MEVKIVAKPVHLLNAHTEYVNKVLFLPNGNLASCSDDGTLKVWDENSGEFLYELVGHTDTVVSLVILPNGQLASGSADETIRTWDLEERSVVKTLTGHTSWIISLVVLANGNLASCSWDDTIKIWNPYLDDSETNCLLFTLYGHGITGWFLQLGVLSDGNLVSCSDSCGPNREKESIIRVWNPVQGEMIKSTTIRSKNANRLLVLKNDLVAIAIIDGSIKLVDLNDNTNSRTITDCHKGGAFALEHFPRGLLLTGGSLSDTTIKVWDTESGKLVKAIETDHSGVISTLSVSRCGKKMASGSRDNTIIIWSLNIS